MITKMGRRTANIVTTEEFHNVVVAETIWACAIGKSIAVRRKDIIRSITIDSEIAALLPALTFWAALVLRSARIGARRNAVILALMLCLTLVLMEVVSI